MEITIEENTPIAFVTQGRFIEHCFGGEHYHMYVLDLDKVGHLYVSVYEEDVKKIVLNDLYEVRLRLYGKYRESKAGVRHLNNAVKVYDLKKIEEDKGAN